MWAGPKMKKMIVKRIQAKVVLGSRRRRSLMHLKYVYSSFSGALKRLFKRMEITQTIDRVQ